MNNSLRHLYYRIGIHAAPPGTLFHAAHRLARSCFRSLLWLAQRLRGLKYAGAPGKASIAFKITGGIGDHIIAARYIRDLLSAVGDFEFDVYCSRPREIAWLLAGVKKPRQCHDEYAASPSVLRDYSVVLWLTTFVSIVDDFVDWGVLERLNPRLADICAKIARHRPEMDLIIAHHPYLDGYWSHIAHRKGMSRIDAQHRLSGVAYGGHEMNLPTDERALEKFGIDDTLYITIHNGFDSEERKKLIGRQTATKCYAHYGAVVDILRRAMPDLVIVQIGIAFSSRPIPGVTHNLLDRSTLAEAAEIVRHSALHIDNEGGLVHLASCFGVKSCVLFGPTSLTFFAYPGNINMAPPVCGDCWWSTKSWMSACPLGDAEPRCLDRQSPEVVASAILDDLARNHRLTTAEGSARQMNSRGSDAPLRIVSGKGSLP